MNINRIQQLKNIQNDEVIDYSDIPELDHNFWKNAEIVEPSKKQLISLRLDEKIIKFFKSSGKGYQTKINQVLETYVAAHA